MSIEHLLGSIFLAFIGTFCLFYGTLYILIGLGDGKGGASGDWF